jgi:hypothetical protein
MKFLFRGFWSRLTAKFGGFTYKSTKIEHGEIRRLPVESLTGIGEAVYVIVA